MFSFLHNYHPEPILLSVGVFKIHWYGFLMAAGGLFGLCVILRLAKFYKIKKEDIYDLVLHWIVFAVIGARIYYVIYAWEFFREDLWSIFKIWEGGLAVHGVLIGGFVATYVFCQRRKINFLKLADIIVPGFVLGQVIGRWGNYFNQEIFGKPTELLWGIPIEVAKRPFQYFDAIYFHPTVLYESLGTFVIFAILILFHYFIINNKTIREVVSEGSVFLVYLILYSILRFSLEFYRLDYSPLVFGVRWAQIISMLIVGSAVVGLVVLNKRS